MLYPTGSRTLTARSSVSLFLRSFGKPAPRTVPLCLLFTRLFTFVFIGPIIFAQHFKSTHHFPITSSWDPNIVKAVYKILNWEKAAVESHFFYLIVCCLGPWSLFMLYSHRVGPSEPQCSRSTRVRWITEVWYLERLVGLANPCSRITSSTNITFRHVWSVSVVDLNLTASHGIAHRIYQYS